MPLIDRSYYNAIQSGRENASRNAMNAMRVQEMEKQIARDNQVRNSLSGLRDVTPEGRQNYLQGMASQGEEGFAMAQQVQQMWDSMDERGRANLQRELEDEVKVLMLANDPNTYQTALQIVAEKNPERAAQLPKEWSPQTAQRIATKLNQARSLKDIVDKKATDPSSVREFKFRQGLEGGIGGTQDQQFLRGKRGLDVESLGNRKVIFDESGNIVREYEIAPKITDTPEYKSAVTRAIEETKAAVQKQVQQQGQDYKLDDANRIYSELKGADLDKIYGYGEKWYPEFLRSQSGINLIAQRDQLVSMLKLAARGELKGQGPITEGEQGILSDAVTALGNPNISPNLAKTYLEAAMKTLYRNAGKTFEDQTYKVGQIIDVNGQQYRVTGGDMNDPDVELVQ